MFLLRGVCLTNCPRGWACNDLAPECFLFVFSSNPEMFQVCTGKRRGRDGFFVILFFIFYTGKHVSVDVAAQFLACDKEDFVFDP